MDKDDVLRWKTQLVTSDRETIKYELKIAKGKLDDAMFDMAKRLITSSDNLRDDIDRQTEISQLLVQAVFGAIELVLESNFEQCHDLARSPYRSQPSKAQGDAT